jgi:predicted transcriptional regulator
MTYLLPPLNALRAFEAAARHLSFKQAAHELHVTAGAVNKFACWRSGWACNYSSG